MIFVLPNPFVSFCEDSKLLIKEKLYETLIFLIIQRTPINTKGKEKLKTGKRNVKVPLMFAQLVLLWMKYQPLVTGLLSLF